MSEPNVDRMLLGFSFAAVVISFLWNLDWRHYVRYWIRSDPPYSALLELGFRAFFPVSFVGAFVYLFPLINEKRRGVGDFERAALFSLIWIGIFGVYDVVMRRRLRTKNQPPKVNRSLPPVPELQWTCNSIPVDVESGEVCAAKACIPR
jgi:hypothetical protein